MTDMGESTHIAFTTITGHRILWPVAKLGLYASADSQDYEAVSVTEDIRWTLSQAEYERLLNLLGG